MPNFTSKVIKFLKLNTRIMSLFLLFGQKSITVIIQMYNIGATLVSRASEQKAMNQYSLEANMIMQPHLHLVKHDQML